MSRSLQTGQERDPLVSASSPSPAPSSTETDASSATKQASSTQRPQTHVISSSGQGVRVNTNGPQLYIETPDAVPQQIQVQPHPANPNMTEVVDQEAATKKFRKAELRRQRLLEAEAEHLKQLEGDARTLYIYGFFALPFLWLVSIIYFWDEQKDENASPVIKKYLAKSRVWLIVYTTVFVAWFILFQSLSDRLKAINILSLDVPTPTASF